jgi:hypothetical protein
LRAGLQYGDSEVDEVDDRGLSTPSEILNAFDAFDWSGEVGRAAARFLARRIEKEMKR